MTAVDAAVRALTAPRPFDVRARADGTVGCPRCGDSKWIELPSTEGGLTVRPCSCSPVYDRWKTGFPRQDHESGRRGGEPAFTPKPELETRQEQF